MKRVDLRSCVFPRMSPFARLVSVNDQPARDGWIWTSQCGQDSLWISPELEIGLSGSLRSMEPGQLFLTVGDQGREYDLHLSLGLAARDRYASVRFGELTLSGCGGFDFGDAEAVVRNVDWRFTNGLLVPVGGGAIRRLESPLETSAGAIHVELVKDALTVRSTDELLDVLALPPERLAGRTVLLRGGHYSLSSLNMFGRFKSYDRPLTIASDDPDHPATIDRLVLAGPEDVPIGPLIFRDLVFHRVQSAFSEKERTGAFLVLLFTEAQNISFIDCRFSSDLAPARQGSRMTAEVRGLDVRDARTLSIRGCVFEGLAHAISVSGQDIEIADNIAWRNWADFVQLHPVRGDKTRRVRIIGNRVHDPVGDNSRLHPDFIHIYSRGNVSGGIADVEIAGNVVFLGKEGTRQLPAQNLTRRFGSKVLRRGVTLGTSHHRTLLEINPGGQHLDFLLPERMTLGDGTPFVFPLRIAPGAEGTARFSVSGHERLDYGGRSTREKFLLVSGQGVEIEADPTHRRWKWLPSSPGMQGIFANRLVNGILERFHIHGNILWVNSWHGISSMTAMVDSRINNNTIIAPRPGDADGDGQANMPHDGWMGDRAGALRVSGKNLVLEGNFAGAIGKAMWDIDGAPPPVVRNNRGGSSTLGQASWLAERESGLLPTTFEEAIRLARPVRRGLGIGALGLAADDDYWDFENGRKN